MNKRIIAIIPARYGSTRFPGKPLADLCGKPVIERVYDRAREVVDNVIVATDDSRIYDAVTAFGGTAVMTSSEHRSGTDRVYEAYCKSGCEADVIVNIQGDEPFIATSQIEALAELFDDPEVEIGTLVRKFEKDISFDELKNPNRVKAVLDLKGRAMYFSRSVIPFVRDVDCADWADSFQFYSHLGLYAYRPDILRQLTSLERAPLEKAESLEQLRWLQNGFKIHVALTDASNIGIDTPEDLEKACEIFRAGL